MVAVVDMPRPWAVSMTSSHSGVVILAGTDPPADTIHQDLGASARQRIQAGRPQPQQRIPECQVRPAGQPQHLRRRQRMQPDSRHAILDRPEHLLVPGKVERGIQSALEHDLSRPPGHRLLHALHDLRNRHREGAGIALGLVIGAEPAAHGADVGEADVSVDDERRMFVPTTCLRRSWATRPNSWNGTVSWSRTASSASRRCPAGLCSSAIPP